MTPRNSVSQEMFSARRVRLKNKSLALNFHFIHLLSGALNIDLNSFNRSLFRTYREPPGIDVPNIIGGSLRVDD